MPQEHAPDRCHYGRGCPICTGLTWRQLNDRAADADTNQQDQDAQETHGQREWATR